MLNQQMLSSLLQSRGLSMDALRNPQAAVMQMVQSGQISQQQVNNMWNQAQQMRQDQGIMQQIAPFMPK